MLLDCFDFYQMKTNFFIFFKQGRNQQSLHYVKTINENLNEYEASTTFTVQLRPTSWSSNSNHNGWFIGDSQNVATKNDFLMVLTDLRRLLIRAVYSRNIGATYRLALTVVDILSQ